MDVRECIPRDKFDTERVELAIELGYPVVEPVLGELLAWTADGNWPVARKLNAFLASIGAPLQPYSERVLESDDHPWKYFLLVGIVADSNSLALALLPHLKRLAASPSMGEQAEGVDEIAAQILETTTRTRS